MRFPTSLGESRQHFRPCAQREKARLFSLLFRIRVHHNIVLYPGRSNYLKGKHCRLVVVRVMEGDELREGQVGEERQRKKPKMFDIQALKQG